MAVIYFDYLTTQLQCPELKATQSFDVSNQKPASIVVYDYYETCENI